MDLGRGERMTCVERVAWKLTLPYVKYIAIGKLLYGSKNSNRGSASTYIGGMWREMGGSFIRKGYIYTYC